jgi:hypothetical protein
MKANVGLTDKIIRIVIGLAILFYVGYVLKSWWALIGLIPIITALISYCGLYSVLGISTCKTKDSAKS